MNFGNGSTASNRASSEGYIDIGAENRATCGHIIFFAEVRGKIIAFV